LFPTCYRLTFYNGKWPRFKIRKCSKVHKQKQIVLIVLVKDEHTGLHSFAKRICDRLCSFILLIKRLAVAMVNKTVVSEPICLILIYCHTLVYGEEHIKVTLALLIYCHHYAHIVLIIVLLDSLPLFVLEYNMLICMLTSDI
jgi:hypothetical protein